MATMTELHTISCQELRRLCGEQGEVELLDVRTPAEFQEMHVPFARNMPLDALNPDAVMRGRSRDRSEPLYLICRSGNRGKQACEKFIKAGHTHVVNVEGGTLAWDAAGFPVVRGRKVISLERQVRIAAGFLVLVGSLLGFFVHEYFLAIPAFVGAGLMFAGITDTCGMGMMLARMPWNQAGKSATCSSSPQGKTTCCS